LTQWSSQPIVSANDFREYDGKAVADPFAIHHRGVWYLFFELFIRGRSNAVIGASRSSNLVDWEPLGIVLDEPHHLSYPFVFEYEDEIYMMPETKSLRSVCLYQAVDFPFRWKRVKTLLSGRLMDCSLIQHQGRFWMFAGWQSYWLRLFHATNPLGPWRPHWLPVLRKYSKSSNRPGGRPVRWNGNIVRFSQDNTLHYGQQLRAWRVSQMNRLWYSEAPLFDEPILKGSGQGWNARCMHHIDLFESRNFVGNNSDTSSPLNSPLFAFVDGSA
jgi:hypothetical protein